MCKLMEDMVNEEKIRLAGKLILRGKDTLEEIAELTGLTLEKVEEVAEEINPRHRKKARKE